MIKKINYLIIIVAIIGSIYITVTHDDSIVYVLKDLSIILTINALYIIKKIFKLKISDEINFIYILFIFMAHFIGVTCEVYDKIYWFDKFVHFMSGIVTSFAGLFVINKFKKDDNIKFTILFIIAFSLMAASLWEIFEYLSSYYFDVDPQKVILTGVTDTMGDIIVAFLGSILISISYYFEYNENNSLLIKKFMKALK